MLTAADSALVAGSSASRATKAIQVARPFVYGGGVVAVGTRLEVPAAFAVEMVSAHKAVFAEPLPVVAVEQEAVPERAPRGRSRKETSDAE